MLEDSRVSAQTVSFGMTANSPPYWDYNETNGSIYGNNGAPQYPVFGTLNDNLLFDLSGMEYVTPWILTTAAFGHGVFGSSTAKPSRVQRLGYKPSKIRFGPDPYTKFADYLLNVKALFTDWNFVSSDQDVTVSQENPISHVNIKGFVLSGSCDAALFRGVAYPYPDRTGFRSATLSGGMSNPIVVGEDYFTIGEYDDTGHAQTALPIISDRVEAGYYDTPGAVLRKTYSNFDYSWNGDGSLDVSYDVENYTDRPSDWLVWRTVHTVTLHYDYVLLSPSPWDETFVIGDHIRPYVLLKYVRTYEGYASKSDMVWKSAVADFGWSSLTEHQYDHTNFVNLAGIAEPSRFDEFIGYSPGLGYIPSQRGLLPFVDVCRFITPDVYRGAFYSSKDAIDTAFNSFSSNHIEAVLELKELGGLLSVGPLLRWLWRGGLAKQWKALGGFSKVRYILDVLTDAKLMWSLGVAPTLSDANEIAFKSGRIMERYITGEFARVQTYYGEFSYPVPEEFCGNYPGMRIDFRSKVRVGVSADSILFALLPIRGAGFLPSLASVWDLIPGSFVVDMFSNMGDYLELVDTQAIFLALECSYCVHSLTFHYNFSAEDESEWDFTVESRRSTTGYQVYVRWVDTHLPIYAPTRLNFSGPPVVHDVGLLGSLIYKFL